MRPWPFGATMRRDRARMGAHPHANGGQLLRPLALPVLDRVPSLGTRTAGLRQHMQDQRTRHRTWTREHGEDLPEVRDWVWPH